ncbi:MAG: hypothetical protein AAGC47_11030 [Bacteroidota bacterium]
MADRIDIGLRERIFFITFVFAYLLLRLLESGRLGIEFTDGHLSDLFFIPLLMTSVKTFRWLFNLSFSLGKKEVLIAVVYSVIVFEWLLPTVSESYVRDFLDVLAYILGGVFYITFVSKSLNRKSKIKTRN